MHQIIKRKRRCGIEKIANLKEQAVFPFLSFIYNDQIGVVREIE